MIQISQEIEPYSELLLNLRRDLHRIPEQGYSEFKTQKYIMDFLAQFPCFTVEKCGGTGVKATCLVQNAKETVGFRADMDALAICEQSGREFASKHVGMMHACGHDGHMAMLLGLACYIAQHQQKLEHNVVLLFQPAEESNGGACLMIKEGCLANPKVDRLYGYHLMPSIPIGMVGLKSGPLMAQACEFDVTFHGRSAHGAMPQCGADAVAAACEFVNAVHGIITRTVDPYEPALVTFGSIHGGTKRNVLCDRCTLEGTMRTFSEALYKHLKEKIHIKMHAIAESYGCHAEFTEHVVYPCVHNPERESEALAKKIGTQNILVPKPMMIAEDYSFYQQQVPAVFVFLGCKDEVEERALHSERFDFDERALCVGLALYASILNL